MEDLLSTGKAKPGDTALLLGYGARLSYAGTGGQDATRAL